MWYATLAMRTIRRLIWNINNVAHVARHKVTPDEVEEACHGAPMTNETYKGRIRVVGLTKKHRLLTVILAPKDKGDYYAVTAHPASRKERRRYQEIKGGDNK